METSKRSVSRICKDRLQINKRAKHPIARTRSTMRRFGEAPGLSEMTERPPLHGPGTGEKTTPNSTERPESGNIRMRREVKRKLPVRINCPHRDGD